MTDNLILCSDNNETTRLRARVSAVHKDMYELLCGGALRRARLRRSLFGEDDDLPTVGDYVEVLFEGEGMGHILSLEPRRSYFARREPGRKMPRAQAVAANFDWVFIMSSLDGDFNIRRLERYLTLSWGCGAVPVILLTKADIGVDIAQKLAAAASVASGADIIALSTRTMQGMDRLSAYLTPGSTAVLMGSSGVGKSSLVNALTGEDSMRVQRTRDVDASKGRHTTVHRQLLALKSGAWLIDTPGMRELGIFDCADGVEREFSDIAALARQCRFRDCTHTTEPGCAILCALADGTADPGRVSGYLALQSEQQSASSRRQKAKAFGRRKAQYEKDKARMDKDM